MNNESEIQQLKSELSEIKEIVKQIKTKVTNIEELEESEIVHLLSVKDLEKKELIDLDKLKELENSEIDKLHKITPKKFIDITRWKKMVWDSCENRKMNDTKRIVTFTCDITNKACSMEFCPKNKFENIDNAKQE